MNERLKSHNQAQRNGKAVRQYVCVRAPSSGHAVQRHSHSQASRNDMVFPPCVYAYDVLNGRMTVTYSYSLPRCTQTAADQQHQLLSPARRQNLAKPLVACRNIHPVCRNTVDMQTENYLQQ